MKNINSYIIEKLHIDKDINISSNDNYEEMENIINDILSSSIGDDKYEVSFKHSDEEEVYIVITFEKTYSNASIHDWGYKIFNKLYDAEKFIPYGSGSNWWVSVDKKTNKTTIIIKLAYK